MQPVDLRSDTVTRPSKAMLDAMYSAKVGDDVFKEDPTVNELEQMTAEMFGKEAALFCPSGTMTNQIAINVQTRPGDEVICARIAHIYRYEGGGIAKNSGASVCLIDGDRGRLNANDIKTNINPDNPHKPRTTLVAVENTVNAGGGAYYNYDNLIEMSKVCKANSLKFHLDGARIFNALAETDQTPQEIGKLFDSISVCLSKGLGAPVGSLVLGSNDFIKMAIRSRKVFGGGMRQAGILAAAGIYALKNNISRLKEDHIRAKEIEKVLRQLPFIEQVLPVDTNILIFKLVDNFIDMDFLKKLSEENILAIQYLPQWVRMVTHLDFTDDMLERLIKVISKIKI